MRDQEPLFGAVASDATAWRTVEAIARDPELLGALRGARREAREGAWAAGAQPEGPLFVDLDPTLIEAGSEKQGAAGTFKGGYGFHPVLAFLDRPADRLRRGAAGRPAAARQRRRQHGGRPDRGRTRRRSSSCPLTSPRRPRSSCASTPPAPRTDCWTGRARGGSALRSAST